MTPEQRKLEEEKIRNNFSELQKRLESLKSEITNESDATKKQEKQAEFDKMKSELDDMKNLIDKLSSLQEQDLQSLKTRLEQYSQIRQKTQWEVADLQSEKTPTPTTCELLKNSETYNRLLNIISSNKKEFKNLPWDTAEKKLEYIFAKVRNSIVLFLKNKIWQTEKHNEVINNTIAPAFERCMMELLRDQGNETNVSMLKWMDKISWENFNQLVKWVSEFATTTKWSFNKFNQWVKAIDYLSVHNWVLKAPEKSKVLTSPVEFKKYLNSPIFASENFSPYATIDENIFQIDETQNLKFWISLQDKQGILNQIWNIKVANNPRTTALIVSMLDKSEKFLWATSGLQETANYLLDWINAINPITQMFWVDILWEIAKAPEERNFLFKIMDFVCKLIWITWGLEWIVKKRRLDRLNLTDEKNDNISQIFKEYQKLAWKWNNISITDVNSCQTALSNFNLTELDRNSTTKWDYLRDVMADNMDINLISPAVIHQTLWDPYLKKEVITTDWKQQEKVSVDFAKITERDKKTLAHKHILNMKTYLESNFNNLKEFYSNIHNIDDLVICMTASLYAEKDDVIEWIKAQVFLPENYGVIHTQVETGGMGEMGNSWWRKNLDSAESSDKQVVSEQWIYDKAIEYWITDKRQIAYVLSTVKWESWFKNQEEIGKWRWKKYWVKDKTTWHVYYGRWFIQLTRKENYQKYTDIIRSSWKDFKDNNWNVIKWSSVDLVKNPDMILQSNDLAAFILMDWMKNGWPDRLQKKRLDYYVNDNKQDYYNARIIINGMSSKPQEYVNNAQAYLNKLWNWSIDSPIERNDLLIWPNLLAHNKDEIWWLGNSIMNGFQWLTSKSNFPNMDWVEWKSTVTHPNRFNSQNDVLAYRNSHPNIKSFMFYFGVNTRDNAQTISDIKQRSEWLQAEWIQPVLCTCIWEDKKTWLKELNQKLITLWRQKNWPILDFAQSYSKWDIALNSDWVHPTSYSQMTNIINWQLSMA